MPTKWTITGPVPARHITGEIEASKEQLMALPQFTRSMQCDEEAIVKARLFQEVARWRYELVVAAAYLRSARRTGGATSFYARNYCTALDRLWDAQQRFETKGIAHVTFGVERTEA